MRIKLKNQSEKRKIVEGRKGRGRTTDDRRGTIADKKQKKKEEKKDKKSRKYGFLREILKNGVAGGSKKCDFIGLICF